MPKSAWQTKIISELSKVSFGSWETGILKFWNFTFREKLKSAVDQITKNWMKYRMGVERTERGLDKEEKEERKEEQNLE